METWLVSIDAVVRAWVYVIYIFREDQVDHASESSKEVGLLRKILRCGDLILEGKKD